MTPEEQQAYEDYQSQQQQPQGGGIGNLLAAYGVRQGVNTLTSSGAAAGQSISVPSIAGAGGEAVGSGMGLPTVVNPIYGEVATATPQAGLQAGQAIANPSQIGMANYAGPVVAALGAKGLYDNWGKRNVGGSAMSGAALGAGLNMAAPLLGMTGIGLPLAIALGLGGGALAGQITAGKHKDQIQRDRMRAGLQQGGIVDQGYNLTLADGSKFNIGVDGGPREQYGMNSSGEMLRAYEVDDDRQFSHQALGWALPLATVMAGGDKKLTSDLAGYLTNAALSNADNLETVRANLLSIAEKAGLSQDKLNQALSQMKASGVLNDQSLAAHARGADILYRGLADQYDTRTIKDFLATQQQAAPTAAPMATPTPMPRSPMGQMAATQGQRPVQQVSSGGFNDLIAKLPGGMPKGGVVPYSQTVKPPTTPAIPAQAAAGNRTIANDAGLGRVAPPAPKAPSAINRIVEMQKARGL